MRRSTSSAFNIEPTASSKAVRMTAYALTPSPSGQAGFVVFSEKKRLSIRFISVFALLAVLGSNFLQNRTESAAQKGDPMNISRITVEHVRVVADKPIDKGAKRFEQQLGQFNPEVYQLLNAGENPDKVRAKLEAMIGPSGFMLFRTADHGALLRLVGQEKKKAVQYLVGNSLFAVQMTQHDIRVGLYAPL